MERKIKVLDSEHTNEVMDFFLESLMRKVVYKQFDISTSIQIKSVNHLVEQQE